MLPLRAVKGLIVWEVVSEVRVTSAYLLVKELERNLWETFDRHSIGLSVEEELG